MLCYATPLTACFLARLCRVSRNAEQRAKHDGVSKQHHNAVARDIDGNNAARETNRRKENIIKAVVGVSLQAKATQRPDSHKKTSAMVGIREKNTSQRPPPPPPPPPSPPTPTPELLIRVRPLSPPPLRGTLLRGTPLRGTPLRWNSSGDIMTSSGDQTFRAPRLKHEKMKPLQEGKGEPTTVTHLMDSLRVLYPSVCFQPP